MLQRCRPIIIAIITLPLFITPAMAAEYPADEFSAIFRVIWALLIVLAIILILYALFKKRFSLINANSSKSIRILEIQPLMPKKAICLVEVRGKEYLLGIGNEDITFLASLDQDTPTSFSKALHDSKAKL
ncbi:flagellar biosynthetic protein FliO [Desulfosediminicola flagellatus]|uniref:flagellar biosynthetic protein FliO n=1 Tax=Desulfosediminicola flagellatus TaxID=2569541 RepID=UPI0010ABC8C9|nr:flagellar biosynthetic protein FliO [Desulfosediminicola flagellatus]